MIEKDFMPKFLENKKIIDEFIEFSSQDHTPFKFTPLNEKYFRKLAEINCYEYLFIPRRNRLTVELNMSAKTITRAKQFCLEVGIIEIVEIRSKFGKMIQCPKVKMDAFKEIVENARVKAQSDKVDKIRDCGKIDLMWSTDHPEPKKDVFRQKGTKCPTNMNNTIKDKEYNLINICEKNKNKMSQYSEQNKNDNRKAEVPQRSHQASNVTFTPEQKICQRNDQYHPDKQLTKHTQVVETKDYLKFSLATSISDNGSYVYDSTNNFKKKASKQLSINEHFKLTEMSYSLAKSLNMKEDEINTAVKRFLEFFKGKTSSNPEKAFATWLHKYHSNFVSHRTSKSNNVHVPKSKEWGDGHETYDRNKVIEKSTNFIPWRERQRLFEMNRENAHV